jgi:TRAP-type C4-dicarboxylate transport system permease small subunit
MQKITQIITKVLEIFLIILMAAIVIDVVWQIFTRFILRDPSSFTEELAGFLLIWIGLLGASYALHTKAHLGIDILTSKLEGTRRRLSIISIYSLVVLFALFILVIGGMRLVNITFTLAQISPAMGIPMGYVYIVLPLTGILMIYYSIMFMINATGELPESTDQVEIKSVD